MNVFDAHCHLDQLPDPDEAIERAFAAGVHRMVAIAEDESSGKTALELKARYPGKVFAGLGVHPVFSVSYSPEEMEAGLAFIHAHLEEADCLGEVGLDFKYAKTEEEKSYQADLLARMMAMAKAAAKPVNLHSRRSQRQTMEAAIAFTRETGLPALMHWFTQSKKLIRICAEEGIYVSAGPSVLFDEQAAMVSCHIPDALLLVETDSPVPYGGKPAEPAWAVRVVERLAEVRGVDPSDLASILNENLDRYLCL